MKRLLLVISLLLTAFTPTHQVPEYDVVIVGAGSGGISAAIQASRMGSSVLLIEETNDIGGQIVGAGVTSMDGNYNNRYGLYKEFIDRIITYYSGNVGGCYFSANTICFEPHTARDIFIDMIDDEENITLLTGVEVLEVYKTDSQITGISTSVGGFETSIIVDATEYGDIIPLAGANYRIGNQTNETYNTPACIQDITYTAIIKEYPSGIPTNLQINSAPTGYNPTLFSGVTNAGSTVWNGTYPVNFNVHNQYRWMQNGKTGINWFNDLPTTTEYLYDKEYREEVNCGAKLRTLQFLYYIQNGLNKNWSIVTDEYDSPTTCDLIPDNIEQYMSTIPYVRESIRGIGLVTLEGSDILRNSTHTATRYWDSIAVGDYPNDLHGCSTASDLESFDTVSDFGTGGVFQVPIGVLISENVDGLLFAEKNISVSRVVNGSTRLQPITMLVGQAVGALASISSQLDISPSEVNTLEVQQALLEYGDTLFPYTDMNPTHPYFVDMQMMSARGGLMAGYSPTTFGANDNLTRGQMAVILTKAFEVAPVTPIGRFSDVAISDPFAPYIEAFYLAGFTSGCATNPLRFCPNDNITNAQFAVFSYRGWMRIDTAKTTGTQGSQHYSDVPVGSTYYPYIENLAIHGIIWNCSANNFCQSGTIKRSTASFVINRILNEQ